MLNEASKTTASTLQPFRLLDLPRELLIPVFRSYRSPITDSGRGDGLFIYAGEQDFERDDILRRLCLTHRDILPFAQEELFKRLDIWDDETMYLLNRSTASSERCKGYAGRAESIFLGEDVDPDGLMESGAFNPRELYSDCDLKFSLLNRFQNLRRIYLESARLDEPLVLPTLESYSVDYMHGPRIDVPAPFQSVNLPNLRRLIIRYTGLEEDTGQIYGSIIPQLDHLSLYSIPATKLEHLLVLSTSLQSLRIKFMGSNDEVRKVHNQISRIDVKGLHYLRRIERESSDNWETDFESIQKFKKVVEGKDELNKLELNFLFQYRARPSEIVSALALARWKAIKGELESICVKKRIEVGLLTCSLLHFHTRIWTA